MAKIIGIDFDDVLMDFNTALAEFHNSVYGTSYGKSDILSERLEDLWKCSHEECFRRVSEFYRSQHHVEAPLVLGAIEATKKLSEDHKLFIITSRPEEVKEHTETWLDKHFPNTFAGIYLTNLFSIGDTKKSLKSEACRELGVDIFVDDFVHHVLDVSASGRKSLLFDAPWNRVEIPQDVARVHSWEEIIQHVENF